MVALIPLPLPGCQRQGQAWMTSTAGGCSCVVQRGLLSTCLHETTLVHVLQVSACITIENHLFKNTR
jgi:hypothetical protein